MNRKSFFIAVTLLVLTAISLNASVALTQGAVETGETIPYQGRLNNTTGKSVSDGAYDFTFSLYDAPDGGNLLWSETQSSLIVQNGAFSALLGSVSPLPADIKSSGKLWLNIGVRGPGETEFTALNPRQSLSDSPTSTTVGQTCAHTHFGETWTGTGLGLALNSDGAGGETLYVTATGNHDAVRAYSSGTGLTDAAFKGTNLSSGTGVYGSSATGSGVVANNSSPTGTALNITQGAFKVSGAGVGTNTTVFIHQAKTGVGSNMCSITNSATVINTPLVNGDPNAILIVTVNGGIMGSVVAPSQPQIGVSFDANNYCGFGQRWLINNLSFNPIPDGAKFNVLVVKP